MRPLVLPVTQQLHIRRPMLCTAIFGTEPVFNPGFAQQTAMLRPISRDMVDFEVIGRTTPRTGTPIGAEYSSTSVVRHG